MLRSCSLHEVNIVLKFRLNLPFEITGKTTCNITPQFMFVFCSNVSVIVTF